MEKKAPLPKELKAVAGIFLIVGGLELIALFAFMSGPTITLGTNAGVYRPLPGATDIVRQSVPENVYYLMMAAAAIFFAAYLLEGILLFKLTKFSFWLGILLSVFMAFSFPLGTALGAVNIYLLYKNMRLFYPEKKS